MRNPSVLLKLICGKLMVFKGCQPLSRLYSWRLYSWLPGTIVIFPSSFLLAACILTADQSVEANLKDPRQPDIVDQIRSIDLLPRQTADVNNNVLKQAGAARAAIFLSDGKTGTGVSLAEPEDAASGGGYDLNFENAPVAAVAKVILGDILGVGYTIDPRVQSTVTLASVRPVAKADALYVLENALRMSGVALLRDRSGYRLLPINEAGPGSIDRAAGEPGQGISVVPLRYVSSQTIFKLLDAFGVKAAAMRPDNGHNTLIISGSGSDRAAAIDTILSFDADWMRGQSVGIFPVHNSTPEPIIAEIEKIMDSGDGGLSQNLIKFQAMARLNGILVVSQKPEYLKRAAAWIARLDQSDTAAVNLKSYPLRYGSAKLITALLNEMLTGRSGSGSLDSASSQISPGSGISTSSSSNPLAALSAQPASSSGSSTSNGSSSLLNSRAGSNPGLGGSGGFGASGSTTNGGANGGTAGGSGAGGDPSAGGKGPGLILPNVRITADITNNAVLVYADQDSQRIVEQTIRQIDRPQRQIAIEATIAEVTLNDTLNYGVQFFLASQQGSAVSTLGSSTAISSTTNTGTTSAAAATVNAAAGALMGRVLPGFNFLIGSESSPRVILDALHNVTDVKVLSNPSLVVLDNQAATLVVGDQVPFSTGSATVLTANNSIVNTIDYKNTGIILRVLPRSNANGNVVLDIEQEISSIAAGTAAGSLTPTISQRQVKSTIAVNSGQTVLLAGLITENENKQKQGIPLLDSIPGLGDALSHQDTSRARTELILFIRPTVIRDPVEAHTVAEEMRSKMNSRLVGTTLPVVSVDPPKAVR
jgi:general secretion pathway protein D